MIKIAYTLGEEDYLNHQLYVASKSERIISKRKRNRFLLPIFYVLFGVLSLFTGLLLLGITFVVLAIVWFFVYPVWEAKRYIRHFKGFIKENYKPEENGESTILFDENSLLASDSGSEGRVNYTELKRIEETPTLFILRMSGVQAFVLPKNQLEEVESFRKYLKSLSQKCQIDFVQDSEWKWK